MFSTNRSKRAQVLVLFIILSLFLTATASFAVSKLIKADKGGKINIARGVKLIIPPGALEEDTVIEADIAYEDNRICYNFGPDGTVFNRPAKLVVSCKILIGADVDDLILYGEDGEEIRPTIGKKWKCLIYDIEHFSIYYHRRR